MNIQKIIWLAGLFEGEGTTGLYKTLRGKEQTWRIQTYWLICNNDPVIINEVYKIAEEIRVGMCIFQRNINHPMHNVNYQILCKSMGGTYKMLSTIFPYLVGNKKGVAEMTMRFIELREFGKTRKTYSEEEWKLYKDVKQINQTGRKKTYLSSETLRSALENIQRIISGEDIVRTSMRIGEEIKE
jgi:hypothetical protein